jgi:hypothetical protein
MKRMIAGAALAVFVLGSAAAFAADAPTTPPADAPKPPADLKCKAPEVPTQVKDKDGKMVWKCVKPKTN